MNVPVHRVSRYLLRKRKDKAGSVDHHGLLVGLEDGRDLSRTPRPPHRVAGEQDDELTDTAAHEVQEVIQVAQMVGIQKATIACLLHKEQLQVPRLSGGVGLVMADEPLEEGRRDEALVDVVADQKQHAPEDQDDDDRAEQADNRRGLSKVGTHRSAIQQQDHHGGQNRVGQVGSNTAPRLEMQLHHGRAEEDRGHPHDLHGRGVASDDGHEAHGKAPKQGDAAVVVRLGFEPEEEESEHCQVSVGARTIARGTAVIAGRVGHQPQERNNAHQ
mmetsp:Transcript_75911/g.246350  ORF Transcript_75911/g.246350 Transcript_75911/m.246350 type:complete len:273 (+) Transcript_75911:1172-1990(+)